LAVVSEKSIDGDVFHVWPEDTCHVLTLIRVSIEQAVNEFATGYGFTT
jgi:hypothetical protein